MNNIYPLFQDDFFGFVPDIAKIQPDNSDIDFESLGYGPEAA